MRIICRRLTISHATSYANVVNIQPTMLTLISLPSITSTCSQLIYTYLYRQNVANFALYFLNSFRVRISTITVTQTIGHRFKYTTTNEPQVHSARSSLVVTYPSTNRGRRALTERATASLFVQGRNHKAGNQL